MYPTIRYIEFLELPILSKVEHDAPIEIPTRTNFKFYNAIYSDLNSLDLYKITVTLFQIYIEFNINMHTRVKIQALF